MNAENLFKKYSLEHQNHVLAINQKIMVESQFIKALSEALCCGQVQPVVSKGGEVDGEVGVKNAGSVLGAIEQVVLLAKQNKKLAKLNDNSLAIRIVENLISFIAKEKR